MTKVSVIIPYFQRKPGILRRALMSVLQQYLTADIEVDVIVVDDGSPISAQSEIETLDFRDPFHLILISQENGGVAAARNTALSQVSSETKYIAFLDADDIWEPEHLSMAISALEYGFDFYFCNNRRKESYDNHFLTISFDPPSLPINIPSVTDRFYEINKERFINLSLRKWASLTPTIVCRNSICYGMEFDNNLIAGEDRLFFMQIIVRCQRICYSPKIWVTCADGIGVWENRYSWDAPTHRISRLSLILAEQEMRKRLPLSKENKQYLDFRITRYRRSFAYLMIRWFLKKRELWSKDIGKMIHFDPNFWFWFLLNVIYVVVLFPLKRYTPLKE